MSTSRELLPFGHVPNGRVGLPFIDHLDERCGGNRALRQRQLAFIHEWDVVLDDLQRRPTVAEYAERWRTAR
jgi:hypothetical protein